MMYSTLLPERGRLEHMGDTRMHVSLVAGVWRQLYAQKSGQILVRYDVLQASNVQAPGSLQTIKMKIISNFLMLFNLKDSERKWPEVERSARADLICVKKY
jgi:hypothetical protein